MSDFNVRTFTIKFCWDRENDCDLASGFTAATDETLAALKMGPFLLIWGGESDEW